MPQSDQQPTTNYGRTQGLNKILLASTLGGSVIGATHGLTPGFTYSPYGHSAQRPALSAATAFNGELPDVTTGFYLFGNGRRAFSPVLMRFLSADYLSPFGLGGINTYAYCVGDPINRYDPTGQVQIPLQQPNRRSPPASPLGLFGKIKGAPHLMEKIVRQLHPIDLIPLSATSKSMKDHTFSAAKKAPTPQILHAGDRTIASFDVSQADDARAILTGAELGTMPAQVLNQKFKPNDIRVIEDLGDGYFKEYGMFDGEHSGTLSAFKTLQKSLEVRRTADSRH
ncbi:MAG: RHS repeat-associated core domain-containing protein [Pseudomonas sp.]|jgi:RHS repeat-associated protein|nr:RHS repeat-associated core domain-containing protein [Pseudomonas sp.]